MFKIIYIVFFAIYLYLINSFQKKFNFCLDKISNIESHKYLLNKSSNIPLSGSFFIFSFFRFLKVFSISRDKFLLFNLFIILIYFVPFIPRESFFNDWNAIIFWGIFSILYSSYNKLKKISD